MIKINFPLMKLSAWRGLPAYTAQERRVLEGILLKRAQGRSLNIFEYGAGYSTLYYSGVLKEQRCSFQWHAVEHQDWWWRKVQQQAARKGILSEVFLYLCALNETQQDIAAYVQKPLHLNMKWDIILVDGRFRRRCMEIAKQCLKPDGVIVLHDAQRPYYHSACALFPHHRWISSSPCGFGLFKQEMLIAGLTPDAINQD